MCSWRHALRALRSRRLALCSVTALLTACSAAGAGPEGGARPTPVVQSPPAADAPAVRALFELSADPMRFNAIPWPDDLYLDAAHRIATRDLPGLESAREYRDALAAALGDLDGFGLSPTVLFRSRPSCRR
jgi:hypothetical protein